MSSTRIQRFDFGGLRDFRGPIVVQAVEEVAPIYVAPPPPTFSEAQLEAARVEGRKQGYTEGFAAGDIEARKQFDSATDAANTFLGDLAQQVGHLHRSYVAMLESETAQLSQLILSVARKVADDALDARGGQAIETMVKQCLPVIFSKPRLVIDLNPDIFAQVVDRIEAQLRAAGFEGEIQFRGNAAMGLSDIAVDWGSGQTERSVQKLWAEVEAIIARVPLELAFAETLEPNTITGA